MHPRGIFPVRPAQFVLALTLSAAPATAALPDPNDRQPTVAWHPAWAKFRASEYVATTLLVAADVVIVLKVRDPDPHWDGGIPSDDQFHALFRAKTPEGRMRAQVWSDTLHQANFFVGLLEAPIGAAARGQWEVAWQVGMMNAEAYALAGLIQLGSARLVGRVRPRAKECEETGSTEFPCNHGGPTLSFISGHAMTSFVSAGLMCAHHGRLPLWGGGWGDFTACASMLVSATATGFLRVTADKHYTSDVMIGSILGFAIGYSIPMLFHYRKFNEVPKQANNKWFVPLAPMPMFASDRIGASWTALF
jgi:membrane-associated phospholipid phosphatase